MNKNIKIAAITAVMGVMALSSCGSQEGVINVWTGFGTSMTTAFENVLQDYRDAHPDTGFKIVHTGQGGYDNLLSTISGSVSTRTYPQLAVAYPDHMAQYNESSILFSLDNYIKEDNVNLDDYYQNYLKECQEIVDGQTMGLPFNKSTEVLTTNQTFVDVLIAMTKGTENEITKVPTTWQEVETFGLKALNALSNVTKYKLDTTSKQLVADSKKGAFNGVLAQNANGEVKCYSNKASLESGYSIKVDLTSVSKNDFRVLSYDSQSNFFITIVRQWGGTYTEIVNQGGNEVGVMRYKSESTANALMFFKRLFDEGLIGIPSTFGEASYTSTPFKAFKTIFTIGSSAGVSNCVPADNLFEVEINPIPYNAEEPDCKFVISQGTNLVMFKNTDEASRKETWNLMKALSYDPVMNATFAKSSGYIPVTKNAYETDLYQDYLEDETLTGTAKTMRDAINVNFDDYLADNSTWTQFVDPGFVGSSSIRANVGSIMGAVRDLDAKKVDIEDTKTYLDLLETYYQLDKGHIPQN